MLKSSQIGSLLATASSGPGSDIRAYVFGPLRMKLKDLKELLWSALVAEFGGGTLVPRWGDGDFDVILDIPNLGEPPKAITIYEHARVRQQWLTVRVTGDYIYSREHDNEWRVRDLPDNPYAGKCELFYIRVWEINRETSWAAIGWTQEMLPWTEQLPYYPSRRPVALLNQLVASFCRSLGVSVRTAPARFVSDYWPLCVVDPMLKLQPLQVRKSDKRRPELTAIGPVLGPPQLLSFLLINEFAGERDTATIMSESTFDILWHVKHILTQWLGNGTSHWIWSADSTSYFRVQEDLFRTFYDTRGIWGGRYDPHQQSSWDEAWPEYELAILDVRRQPRGLWYWLEVRHVNTNESKQFCADLVKTLASALSNVVPAEERVALEDLPPVLEVGSALDTASPTQDMSETAWGEPVAARSPGYPDPPSNPSPLYALGQLFVQVVDEILETEGEYPPIEYILGKLNNQYRDQLPAKYKELVIADHHTRRAVAVWTMSHYGQEMSHRQLIQKRGDMWNEHWRTLGIDRVITSKGPNHRL